MNRVKKGFTFFNECMKAFLAVGVTGAVRKPLSFHFQMDFSESLKELFSSFLEIPKACSEPLASLLSTFIASSNDFPYSTTLVANHYATACSEEIGGSKAVISKARARPTILGKMNVVAPSKDNPFEVYACFKTADFSIIRKSHARVNEKPAPTAAPLIAATTGLDIRRISTMAKGSCDARVMIGVNLT
jgi:hypothetical protein